MPSPCSFGCTYDHTTTMHRFPNPDKFPERFATWVRLVGGKLETASDYTQYRNKFICDIHFAIHHRNRFKRLNALAVPTLHLHGASKHDLKETQTLNEPTNLVHVENIPSTTQATISGVSKINLEEVQSVEPTNIIPFENISSSSQAISSGSAHQPRALVLIEHSYSAASREQNGSSKTRPVYECEKFRCLRSKIKNLRSEICRLRKKGSKFQTRLKHAEKLTDSTAFQHIVNSMTKPTQLFVHMQLQTKKKPKGRRFTVEEKILALSLYKKSPKCYTLLHKYFTLPSSKAMKRLLSQIKLSPGVNKIIFEKIKKSLQESDSADRLCSLIFDEMSLSPHVFYNSQKDMLEGFSNNNECKFADHVLVFMVKGVKKNFKQPIVYYFTNGMNKFELKALIKTVIGHAQNSGLIVTNTVCDQGAVNVGAINELVNESKGTYLRLGMKWLYDCFIVNGRKIIPLYDTPHLIKGIRNNLLTKDMLYTYDENQYIVKWEYYQNVYAADKMYGELRLLHKITEDHVDPEKINKMKVKSATQIFSHSVAVVTDHLCGRGNLPEDCKQLIKITLLLDNLFDSLNVSSFNIPNGKIYKGPVKVNSPHHKLWKKAKSVLRTIKFIEKKVSSGKIRFTEKSVPSVNNLIKTIEGMEALWEILTKKYGFNVILTRNFNQDPIENFFGNIRSYGVRNNAPNTLAYEGAFKSLLLNNYNAPHSTHSNCEEDYNECLQQFDFFFKEKKYFASSDSQHDLQHEETIHLNEEIFSQNSPKEVSDLGQRNYVCGWVLTKCLKNVVKTCQVCRRNVIDVEGKNKQCDFIKRKEYDNKKWLCYPNIEVDNCFQDLQNITTIFLRKNVPKRNLKKDIVQISDVLIKYPFECPLHMEQLKKYFVNIVINVLIYSWCRSVNRILAGKINYEGEDDTKTAAQMYYNKRKHYKNKK